MARTLPGTRSAVWAILAVGVAAVPAQAELVFLTTGGVLSVRGHRVEDGQVTLALRGGGEVTFASALVARVAPDEVPHPEAVGASGPEAMPGRGAGVRAGGFVPAAAAAPYAALVSEVAAAHGVDPSLVHAVIEAESGYEPRARSPKGARGLMQLMPATARQYVAGSLDDPRINVDAGVQHLRSLLDRLDVPQALAAYNAGEGAVRRHGGVPPYPETERYVRRVLDRLGR